jgi:hypothetical protein
MYRLWFIFIGLHAVPYLRFYAEQMFACNAVLDEDTKSNNDSTSWSRNAFFRLKKLSK